MALLLSAEATVGTTAGPRHLDAGAHAGGKHFTVLAISLRLRESLETAEGQLSLYVS